MLDDTDWTSADMLKINWVSCTASIHFDLIWSAKRPLLGFVSWTQTLITQISRLCQDICDIKRQKQKLINSTPKAEPREEATLTRVQEEMTMDSNQCQDRTNIDGMDGSGCTYSSHSTLPPHFEHSHDIPSRHETSHPPLFSTLSWSNLGQPAARSSSPPDGIQLSISSSPAALYPEAPSSVSKTLIGIAAGNKWDQIPERVGGCCWNQNRTWTASQGLGWRERAREV